MILYGGGARKDGGDGETVMKRGPWTAAEDETLAAYVREHGEGNWNTVQKKTWLARCGKSCRLRWINHLRPNLRKGSFTPEEERLIIQLHSQLGNKWARMAAQLPGRTDNEIKNYWNTRLKRFQRQGLPLYPPDILSNNHHHHQLNTPSPLPLSPTPASSFTFQTPSPRPQYPTLPLFNFSEPQPPSLRPKRCYNSSFTPTSYHNGHFTSSSYYSTNQLYSMKQELPSNQIPYSTSLGVYGLTNFTDKDNYNQSLSNSLRISTCQLLEDVMEEAEALASRAPKRRQLMPAPVDDDNFFSCRFTPSNNLSSQQGLKTKEEESLQMNIMQDEDIADLLDWGSNEGREISNEQSSVEENIFFDDHHFALLFPVNDDDDKNPTVSSWSWDSLSEIC